MANFIFANDIVNVWKTVCYLRFSRKEELGRQVHPPFVSGAGQAGPGGAAEGETTRQEEGVAPHQPRRQVQKVRLIHYFAWEKNAA